MERVHARECRRPALNYMLRIRQAERKSEAVCILIMHAPNKNVEGSEKAGAATGVTKMCAVCGVWEGEGGACSCGAVETL